MIHIQTKRSHWWPGPHKWAAWTIKDDGSRVTTWGYSQHNAEENLLDLMDLLCI